MPGYDLNPGNCILFPWLSIVARGYEKFRFHRMRFELVPRNPTTQQGTVYMGFDYDYDDDVATSPSTLMINRGAISGDVWTPKEMLLDIQRLNEDMPWRYVESGGRSQSTGRMMYGGYLMVATYGLTAAVSFDLFVEYDVELSLPALHSQRLETNLSLPADQLLQAGVKTGFDVLPSLAPNFNRKRVSETPISSVLTQANEVYELLTDSSGGTLRFRAKPVTAGQPPSAYATDTKLSAAIFNSTGGALATDLQALTGSALQFQAPNSSVDWGNNGAPGVFSFTVDLKKLRQEYPTARYLAPTIDSAAGRLLDMATELKSWYNEL
jgi:hypothetical protein